ncbi:MAG: alpha/beta fold hydrolase [Weeksellaceae bacterium]|nr:alpha/beta fold hydrolase [Weeksellaceae bacterium]
MAPLLHHKSMGDAPEHLLIVHGLFGQLDNWNTLARSFAEHFTVHLLDLRNHGRSFHHSDASHGAMAQDLVDYMQEQGIEKAHMIGHSLGGKVVMKLAISHPELIDKAIIADIAPVEYPPQHLEILEGLQAVDFEKIEERAEVDEVLKNHIRSTAVRQFLLKNVFRTKEDKFAFRFNLQALKDSYYELIGNSLVPGDMSSNEMLFLYGGQSDYVAEDNKALIQGFFPNAKFDVIEKAGHWLHAEAPDEFLEKSLDFLQG